MAYDRKCYERRKHGEVAKSEDFEAYAEIRAKWGFDDRKIKRLLETYTRTEILFGDLDASEFRPKEMFRKLAVIALVIAASFFYRHYSSAEPKTLTFFDTD